MKTKTNKLRNIVILTLLTVILHSGILNAQSVGINTLTPDSSALLDLTSTEGGLLVPRMTTADRNTISSPALSLWIFNTTKKCFQTYVDGQWNDIWCAPPTPFVCGTSTVDDPDGHTYHTVLIGSQCWMKENYEYDGDSSGNGCIDEGKCLYYTGGPFGNEGLLYQWSAIMDATPVEGNQGICPAGWHIPSDADWKILEGSLGMSVAEQDLPGWRGTNQGSKMANDVLSISWAAGNLRSNAGFGTSGLDVPPPGYYNFATGTCFSRGGYADLWSSTESGGNAWQRFLMGDQVQVYRSMIDKRYGFSVRCLED